MSDIPEWAKDDPTIAGSIRLLRRVPSFQVNDGVVDSSCFLEKEFGQGLSVTVWGEPSDLDDIRRRHEEFGVICVEASVFRAANAFIARAPLVGNLNHCEVFPRLSNSPRKKLKIASKWVHYPDWVKPEHRKATVAF